MYIKQILYLLEKFVAVLGGRGTIPWRCHLCWSYSLNASEDTWVFYAFKHYPGHSLGNPSFYLG
jgi:hypothetical protein